MITKLVGLDAAEIASESDLTAEELINRGNQLIRLARDLQVQAARLRGEAIPIERPGKPDTDHSVGREGLVDEAIAMARARELGVFSRVKLGEVLGLDGPALSKWIAKLHERGVLTREQDDLGAIVYRYNRPLEDEPADYQLRQWVKRQPEPFDLDMAVDGVGLPVEEVEGALSALIADLTVAPVKVEAVNDLGEIDKLAGAFFQYVHPIPGGVQTDLERRRLASVGAAGSVEVKRGMPVRIRTERRNARARSTPGSRQKVINQDRNWERLEAAKAEREQQGRERAARQAAKPKGKPKRSRPV